MNHHRRDARNQRGAVLLSVMVITMVLMLLASTLINYFLTSETDEVEKSLVDVRTYWAMMGQTTYMLSRTGGQGVCGTLNNSPSNSQTYCGLPAPTVGQPWTTRVMADDAAPDDDGNPDGTTMAPPFNSRSTASPAGSLQSYLEGANEIQTRDQSGAINNSTIINPGSRRWVYPQEIDHSGSVAIGTDATNPYFITVQGIVRDHYVTPPVGGANIRADQRLRIDLSVIDSGTIPVLYDLTDRADRLTIGFCITDSQSNFATPGTFDNRGCVNTNAQPTPSEGVTKIQFVLRNAPIPLTNATP